MSFFKNGKLRFFKVEAAIILTGIVLLLIGGMIEDSSKKDVALTESPESYQQQYVLIGPVAFIGIPGEPFAGISRGIQMPKAFGTVFATCNTNGYEGYFPMEDAYDEGGYEARSSNFRAGVAELLIREGLLLLGELKKR